MQINYSSEKLSWYLKKWSSGWGKRLRCPREFWRENGIIKVRYIGTSVSDTGKEFTTWPIRLNMESFENSGSPKEQCTRKAGSIMWFCKMFQVYKKCFITHFEYLKALLLGNKIVKSIFRDSRISRFTWLAAKTLLKTKVTIILIVGLCFWIVLFCHLL